jgi:hypothetical protein
MKTVYLPLAGGLGFVPGTVSLIPVTDGSNLSLLPPTRAVDSRVPGTPAGDQR